MKTGFRPPIWDSKFWCFAFFFKVIILMDQSLLLHEEIIRWFLNRNRKISQCQFNLPLETWNKMKWKSSGNQIETLLKAQNSLTAFLILEHCGGQNYMRFHEKLVINWSKNSPMCISFRNSCENCNAERVSQWTKRCEIARFRTFTLVLNWNDNTCKPSIYWTFCKTRWFLRQPWNL